MRNVLRRRPLTQSSAAQEILLELSHAKRVAANFPPGSVEHLVALYHDHLEDGFSGPVPSSIIGHVLVLTRGDDESYREYIDRVRLSGNEVAIAVKIADMQDNLARCRGEFAGDVNPSGVKRYEKALAILTAATTSDCVAVATGFCVLSESDWERFREVVRDEVERVSVARMGA